MDRELQRAMYAGFFDEMHALQKAAGLQHFRAAGQMLRHPVTAAKGLAATAKSGWKGTHGLAKGHSGLGGAARALWASPHGRAAMVGGGALGVGALGAGGGYMAGRAQR